MARIGRPPVDRVVLACATCGAAVRKYPSEVRRLKTNRVFCSKRCFLAAGGMKPRTGRYIACRQCGKEIWETPSEPRRYCSISCHNAAQTKPKVVQQCETCGTAFTLARAQVSTGQARFCSRDCMGVARRKRPLDRTHNGKPALLNTDGYVMVWEPVRRAGRLSKYMLEHRLVVELAIGRPLRPEEQVDHINGDRQDNRPENLRIVSASEHGKITNANVTARRLADEAELAEYRRRYGPLKQEVSQWGVAPSAVPETTPAPAQPRTPRSSERR